LKKPPDFAGTLLHWHAKHGRHDLPWQHPRSPYRVWVSEIMLQQTQVRTVIGYFENFMARFASLGELADAPESDVLHAWAGLGYYSRARNLHRAAKICQSLHAGNLPDDFEALLALPGIGRSTAGAILSQAHGQRFAIVDGNVKRVLCRYFGIAGDAASMHVHKQLWAVAESLLPKKNMADYSQAIMDLGATVCTLRKPACAACPMAAQCVALQQQAIADYPGRKARKALPERELFALLLRSKNGDILLQQRPGHGIWGGLHSLPEASDAASAKAFARSWATKIGTPQALAPIAHTFSHYRLQIKPLLWQDCQARVRIGDNGDMHWVSTEQLSRLGLPAPIKKLIGSLP
jgi:A/G-specific adenine glycosylase